MSEHWNDWESTRGRWVEILKCQIEKVTLDQKGALTKLKRWEWLRGKEREIGIGGRIELPFLCGHST